MSDKKILTLPGAKKEELMLTTGGYTPLSTGSSPSIVYQQIISYDADGQIVADVTTKKNWQNGGGFVISYTEKMCEFISKVSTGSVVRLFLFLAHHQNYGADGKTFGYRCSHKYLQQVLQLDKSTLWDAFKFLKDNFLVVESKIDGQTEFMVNPNYVTIGRDKNARLKEWNRRWEVHWKVVHKKSAN